MSLTARVSHSKRGKPIPIENFVPKYARRTFNHKIFWNHKSHQSADQRNSIVTTFKSPCTKRWLEFRGEDSSKYEYITMYTPPAILANPQRVWILMNGDNEPVASYTNVVEAWLVLLGLHLYDQEYGYHLIYHDRSS